MRDFAVATLFRTDGTLVSTVSFRPDGTVSAAPDNLAVDIMLDAMARAIEAHLHPSRKEGV